MFRVDKGLNSNLAKRDLNKVGCGRQSLARPYPAKQLAKNPFGVFVRVKVPLKKYKNNSINYENNDFKLANPRLLTLLFIKGCAVPPILEGL